jgi:hypothetical protein
MFSAPTVRWGTGRPTDKEWVTPALREIRENSVVQLPKSTGSSKSRPVGSPHEATGEEG